MPPELTTWTALDLWHFLQQAGLLGFAILALVGFIKKWWVLRWVYDDKIGELKQQLADCHADGEQWRTACLVGTQLAERLGDHALAIPQGSAPR